MSKVLYTYLPDKNNFSAKNVADDYSPQTNETFVEPVNPDGTGINLPVTFDGTAWKGADKPQIEIVDGTTSDGPTAEQQMINALGLQVASLQATVAKLTTTTGGVA